MTTLSWDGLSFWFWKFSDSWYFGISKYYFSYKLNKEADYNVKTQISKFDRNGKRRSEWTRFECNGQELWVNSKLRNTEHITSILMMNWEPRVIHLYLFQFIYNFKHWFFNLCYSRWPQLVRKLLLLLMSCKKCIRFEDSTVRNWGCRLKKNRCHEAKHNAVYNMTTKAHKRGVVA